MRPFVNLLASLTLDGKLIDTPAECVQLIRKSSPGNSTMVVTDLPYWKRRSHRTIQYQSTTEILQQIQDNLSYAWILGSAALNSALSKRDWVHSLHIWWKPVLSNPSQNLVLAAPFPLQKGFRRIFQLIDFCSNSEGCYGLYRRK